MGKSKGHRKNVKFNDMDDDNMSTTSSTGTSSTDFGITQEPEEEQDEETVLEGFVDALYEKRGSTREAGLKGLINAFSATILLEFSESKYTTLTHQYLSSLRRGSSLETSLAARALGLLAITAGAGDIAKHILDEAYPHLVRIAKLGSVPSPRVSAVDSLAILTFVAADDTETTERSMDVFVQISKHKGNTHADQSLGTSKPTPALKAAAVSGWGLLLSTLPPQRVVHHHVPQGLSLLSSLLDTVDTSLRKACGEAVALLYEVSKPFDNVGDEVEDGWSPDSESYTTAANKLATGKLMEAKEEHLKDQIKSLSIDAGRRGQSKKERSSQRSSFRELLSSIEDGICHGSSVKLRYGDVLRVNTWSETVQLNSLRHFLSEGFQKHMQENPLLHEIFGFVPRAEKRQTLTAKEKRMYLSPNSITSKARTQALNRRRSLVEAGNQGHFHVNAGE